MMNKVLRAIGASPGLSIGKVMILGQKSFCSVQENADNPEDEWNNFLLITAAAEKKLSNLLPQIPLSFSNETIGIFSAYRAILHDPAICDLINQFIFKQKKTLIWAINESFLQFRNILSKVNSQHIAEKVNDLDSVKALLLEQISDDYTDDNYDLSGIIIVAQVLTPRDIFNLNKNHCSGIIAEQGTRSSHVAILARNLDIPAVLGVQNIVNIVHNNDIVAIDGSKGIVEISPSEHRQALLETQMQAWKTQGKYLKERSQLELKLLDDTKINIFANLEASEELNTAHSIHVDGIGLYRMEFFYLTKSHAPTEKELYEELILLVESMPNKPITIRLLDAGGDKEIPSLGVFASRDRMDNPFRNPAMGLRGVRLLLKRQEILHAQCKAIIRANKYNNIQILIPFVSSIEEVRAIKNILKHLWREMAFTEQDTNNLPKIGMMVELPATVAMAGHFTREVDFFSIGTNDLIQHTLAVDRTDVQVSNLYNSYHPAVLNFLQQAIEVANLSQIPVSLCGEMASDLLVTELLLGLGLRAFSTNLHAIPALKEVLRLLSISESIVFAAEIMQFKSAEDIKHRLKYRFIEKFGTEFYSLISD